jgi:hypothetical protein
MAWTDYKKAFDSLTHTWILTVMKMNQICPTIRQFMEASMKEWKTKIGSTTLKGMSKEEQWLLNREYSRVTPSLHYFSV